MNYAKILIKEGLKEVLHQKLEAIALTGNDAPEEIRKITLIEMQLRQQLLYMRRYNLLDIDISRINKLLKKGYNNKEVAIIYNVRKIK